MAHSGPGHKVPIRSKIMARDLRIPSQPSRNRILAAASQLNTFTRKSWGQVFAGTFRNYRLSRKLKGNRVFSGLPAVH